MTLNKLVFKFDLSVCAFLRKSSVKSMRRIFYQLMEEVLENRRIRCHTEKYP